MNEDMMRWLCTALLKTTGGEPVRLTPDETATGFELTFNTDDSNCVTVTVAPAAKDGDDVKEF